MAAINEAVLSKTITCSLKMQNRLKLRYTASFVVPWYELRICCRLEFGTWKNVRNTQNQEKTLLSSNVYIPNRKCRVMQVPFFADLTFFFTNLQVIDKAVKGAKKYLSFLWWPPFLFVCLFCYLLRFAIFYTSHFTFLHLLFEIWIQKEDETFGINSVFFLNLQMGTSQILFRKWIINVCAFKKWKCINWSGKLRALFLVLSNTTYLK